MDFPAWSEFRNAMVPAFVGGMLALGASTLLGYFFRRRRSSVACAEAARAEAGLRGFAAEAEARLDAKLDRLESLLGEARKVSGTPSRGSSSVPSMPPETRSRWDTLGTVSSADRNRVLQLAEMGKLPDAIADAVGLLRGEVDLILRLHRGSSRFEGR